jgi:hypothetical protein
VELPNGDWVLPYTGYTFPHKYPRGQLSYALGYALWPQGRLVAVEATERGEFATVGLLPPGRTLHLNCLTQRVGWIKVEVANIQGNPLPGRSFAEATPITGDQPAALVTWNGHTDLGNPPDAPIILRFQMEKARLFSLDFL